MADQAPPNAIDQALAEIDVRYRDDFAKATDENALRAAHAKFLGRNGALTAVLKEMGKIPANERKAAGQRVNTMKQAVEQAFEARLAELHRAAREADLKAPPFDLTLPGRAPARGHLHPVTHVREDILDVFRDMGFVVAEGPQVELEENNFTKLGFPPDHPAVDMQDTFWVKPPKSAPADARVLLRTHTSNMQVREMSTRKPPMAIVSAGTVYRVDDDPTHTPMFHQMEAFYVDEHVTMAHLKGVIAAFVARLFGERPVRFRPSYFPFVEPGVEVDMRCTFCEGAGCRLCKSTGWMEILGAGMIHPVVFEHCGIDPEKYSGFALGTGLDRPAMQRYGIPDLRLMFEGDVRFLEQF
jgi:phenylalanyl-tRNA synthetase alpha chain